MLVSGFSFALMSAAVKSVGPLPIYEKVFARNFVSLFVALAMILIPNKPVSFFGKWKHQPLLLSRSLLGLAGVYLLFFSISAGLPLTDANILSRLNPVFVTLFACFFLKEKIPSLHIPSLAVILVCAILVIKPEFDLKVLPALAATSTALFAGTTYTILRHLKGKEEPATIVFYFSFVSALVLLLPMLSHFIVPTPEQWGWLLAIGLTGALGQFGLTFAYKFAKASEISIYSYSTILFALFLDLIIWGKMPDVWSLIGGAGIIAAAIVLFIQNKRQSQLEGREGIKQMIPSLK